MQLNAASRLVESMPIRMRENYTQLEFDRDVEFLEKRLKTKPAVPLGTKEGLSLYYLKLTYSRDFFLKDRDRIIGILSTTAKGNMVISVFIEEEYRGRHLGLVLYLAAIHVLGELQSSSIIGIMAVRTWRSVSKYYSVELLDHLQVPVDFSWGTDTIPIVKGKPINKLRGNFYFKVKA
jgi:hypothetical protein